MLQNIHVAVALGTKSQRIMHQEGTMCGHFVPFHEPVRQLWGSPCFRCGTGRDASTLAQQASTIYKCPWIPSPDTGRWKCSTSRSHKLAGWRKLFPPLKTQTKQAYIYLALAALSVFFPLQEIIERAFWKPWKTHFLSLPPQLGYTRALQCPRSKPSIAAEIPTQLHRRQSDNAPVEAVGGML